MSLPDSVLSNLELTLVLVSDRPRGTLPQATSDERDESVLEISRTFFENFLTGGIQKYNDSSELEGAIKLFFIPVNNQQVDDKGNPPRVCASDMRRISQLFERTFSNPASVTLEEIQRNLPHILKYQPNILNDALIGRSNSLEALREFIEAFGNQFIHPDVLGKALIQAAQNEASLDLFFNTYGTNPNQQAASGEPYINRVSTAHLGEALTAASKNEQTLELFFNLFRNRLHEINPRYLEKGLESALENGSETFQLYLNTFSEHANLQLISEHHLGEALEGCCECPNLLQLFIKIFRENSNLSKISVEHLGKALKSACSSELTLQRFIVLFRNYRNLFKVSIQTLESALKEASSLEETLQIFLLTFKSSLIKISSKCLGETLTKSSENREALQLFCRAFRGRLREISSYHL
jgi:hypothetical protein